MLAWENEREQGKLREQIPGLTSVKFFSRNVSVVNFSIAHHKHIFPHIYIYSYQK